MRRDGVMQTIEFRYNRHKTTFSLILLLGFFWLLSLFIIICFKNDVLKITDSYGYFTPYWKEHGEFALSISVLLPVFAMILPIIPVYKLWQLLMDAHGKVKIYANYAILYYGGKDLRIDKDTKINWEYATFGPHSPTTNRHPVMKIYTFQQGEKKYYLSTSLKEAHEKTTWKQHRKREDVFLTLDIAICAIMS